MPVVKRISPSRSKLIQERQARLKWEVESYINSVEDMEKDWQVVDTKTIEEAIEKEIKKQKSTALSGYKQMVEATKDTPLKKVVVTKEGCNLFDILCLRLDLNQKYVELLPQWRDVADLLQMDDLRVKWVEVCVRPKEGLTRAMLEIYMKDGGTLGEVLQALVDLECFEILEKVKAQVWRFVEDFKAKDRIFDEEKPDEGNFCSLLATLHTVFGKNDPCDTIQRFSKGLCQARTVTAAMTHEILVQGTADRFGIGNDPISMDDKYPIFKPRHETSLEDLKKPSGKPFCRILLLFSSDGIQSATNICEEFQGFEYEGCTVDLIRLNESSLWYEILVNPEACCMKWANEVDYVMPILTEKYLREVQGGVNFEHDSLLPTSPIINRFMYTLLRARYAEAGCKNTMVRPVVASPDLDVVQTKAVRLDPLFRLVWIELKDTSLEGRLKSMLKYWKSQHSVSF